MSMTPDEFFTSFVIGNVEDYRAAPGSLRRALNAAISASHMADHWLEFNRRHSPSSVAGITNRDFLKDLSHRTGGAFSDIRSIANAYKHLYTDNNAHATVDSAGAIVAIQQEGDEEVVGLAEDKRDACSRVVFTRRDGAILEFLPVLEAVVKYWQEMLYDSV